MNDERDQERAKLQQALWSDVDKLADFDIWVAACGMVAMAGKRAAKTGRGDINLTCMKFVQEMAVLVGTPAFPTKGSA